MSGHPFDNRIAGKLRDYRHPVSPEVWQAVQAGITQRHVVSIAGYFATAIGMLLMIGLFACPLTAFIHFDTNPDSLSTGDKSAMLSRNEISSKLQASAAQAATVTPETHDPFALQKKSPALTPGNSNQNADAVQNSSEDPEKDIYANRPDNKHLQPAGAGDLRVFSDHVNLFSEHETTRHDAFTRSSRLTGIGALRSLTPASGMITRGRTLKINDRIQQLRTDCYSFGSESISRFFVDVYAGPAYPVYQFKSKSEEVTAYLQGRDTTESSRLSYDAGLRLGYMLKSNLAVMGGLHFTQVNRLFDYYNPSAEQYDTIYTEIKIINGPDTTITIDTSYTLVSGERVKKTYNRYTTLDIPLLVSYTFQSADWSLGINAGPVINLLFRQKGDFLAPDGTPVNFNSNNNSKYPAYRSSIGLSVYASLQVSKRIGYKTWLFAEPHILYRLEDLTIDGYPVSEHQQNIGLAFGVRVKL